MLGVDTTGRNIIAIGHFPMILRAGQLPVVIADSGQARPMRLVRRRRYSAAGDLRMDEGPRRYASDCAGGERGSRGDHWVREDKE